MFHRIETAFKHPKCGGVIYSYEWPERTRFRCGKCYLWGDDLVALALGQVERPQPGIRAEALRSLAEVGDEKT